MGRAAPEEVALEVTRDDHHAVRLPLQYRRPRRTQVFDVTGHWRPAGGFQPARGDA